MMPTPPNSARHAYVRTVRRIEAVCLTIVVAGAAIVIYELGFAVRPHKIGFACMVAAAYVVWSTAGLWLMHRSWTRRARKLPS